jgi:hypothetical protein
MILFAAATDYDEIFNLICNVSYRSPYPKTITK